MVTMVREMVEEEVVDLFTLTQWILLELDPCQLLVAMPQLVAVAVVVVCTPDPGSELPPSTLINPLLATWRVGASMYKFLAFISPPYLTLSTSSTFIVY
jgi:hypothetical protein